MCSVVRCSMGPVLGPRQKIMKPGEFGGGHKDSQGAGACEIQGEAEGAGFVHPGGERFKVGSSTFQ